MTTVEQDGAAPATASPAELRLRGTVQRLLGSVLRSSDLISLQASIPTHPSLSVLVRRPGPPTTALTAWAATAAAGSGHGPVTLVATAVLRDEPRTTTVAETAGHLADLLVVDHERAVAEANAVTALAVAGADALTQLGNRRTWHVALDDERSRAARYERATSIAVLDLDGLKAVNDARGHAAGDTLLVQAAAALLRASRRVDTVCRLGGDEFGVLAPETGVDGASRLASRLRHELAQAGVSASIGVATTRNGDLQQAWQAADEEMYLAKRLLRHGAAAPG